MRRIKKHLHWAVPTLALTAVIALVAWTDNPQQSTQDKSISQDTVPAKRNKAVREKDERDLDKEIRQLDEAKEKLKEVDWDQIKRSVETARKSIDAEQLQKQIDQALKSVDMEKISNQVQESLKSIDLDKLQKEINASVKESLATIDKDELKKHLDEANREVEKTLNSKDWKKEMEELKKIDLKEIQIDMERAKDDVKRALEKLDEEKFDMKENMGNAWKEIDKAKDEFKGYQEMIYSMEKEGLLSTKTDYSIKYKDGNLTVNGKKQPQEVLDRYKKYFSHEKVTIRKEDGDMDIDFD